MLDGRNALVTGASRGIGQAIAQVLVAQGARVIGTATSEAGAQRLSETLGAQGVGRATTNAVVTASILILASNYFLTEALFPAN